MNLFRRSSKPKYALMRGEVDGMPFVAHYDLQLLKFKDKAKYPYMLGISIQGFETSHVALPTNEARPAIDRMEDALIKLVEENSNQIYVGHNFWKNALEVIFYISEYEHLVKVLEKEAANDQELHFTFKVDRDPSWSQLVYLSSNRQ